MSDKETITSLLTVMNSRQAKLTIICKELTGWVKAHGGHHREVATVFSGH
jgi:hypothetical protein